MARKPSRRSNRKPSRNRKKQVSNKFKKETGQWLLRLIVIGLASYVAWYFFGDILAPVIKIICLAIIIPTQAWITWFVLRPFMPQLWLTLTTSAKWLKLFLTAKNVPSLTDSSRKPQR